MSLHEDWNDGIRAFHAGKRLDDNPHEARARQRKWNEGWEYAQHTQDAVAEDQARKKQT